MDVKNIIILILSLLIITSHTINIKDYNYHEMSPIVLEIGETKKLPVLIEDEDQIMHIGDDSIIRYDQNQIVATNVGKCKYIIHKNNENIIAYDIEVKQDLMLTKWIEEHIDPTMNDYDKLNEIIQYCLTFPYDYHINNYKDMLVQGRGECFANSDLIIKLCDILGIEATIRTRSNTLKYPDFHINVMVLIDNQSYMIDTGHIDRNRYEFEPLKGYSYKVKEDNTIAIYDYDGYAKYLEIPAYIDGKKVTEIKEEAFIYHFETKKVIIPHTVEVICKDAFKQCTSLEYIEVSKDTYIEEGAFSIEEKTMLGNTYIDVGEVIIDKQIKRQ